MTVKEIKAMNNVELIANIFYMGILMSNHKPVKKWDLELERYCKECERRGFVEDGTELYREVCK
jgi:hypothetical protein